MSLFDDWTELKGQLAALVAKIDSYVARIQIVEHAIHGVPQEDPAPAPPTASAPVIGPQVTVPVVPTPPPAQTPTVVPVPPVIATRAPKGHDRYIPEEIWDVADREFRAVGLDPDLGIGLEVWETGWFDGLPSAPSPAWSDRNNPGGMKKPPKQFAKHGIVYDRDPEHDTYMRFPAWQEGIRAHAVFIGDSELYKAVHDTKDLDAQVDAIGAAGYAEGADSWRVGVKAKIRQVQALRAKRAGTRPASTPAPTDIGAAILVSAKKAQSLGTSFPYDPQTAGDDGGPIGSLGCANVVSWILRDAGIFTTLILNVDGVVDALLAIGWKVVAEGGPYCDGDVIAWKATPSSKGHQHVGIVDEEGVKVWAYNNSSENRKVVYEALTQGGRPIRCVLRHP